MLVRSTIFGFVCRGKINDFFMAVILKLITSLVSFLILLFVGVANCNSTTFKILKL